MTQTGQPSSRASAVIAARPQAIVAGADGGARPAWLDAWSRWTGVPAVRDRQIHVVDADRLHRPGPRFAEGVAELCAAIDRARNRQRGTNVDSVPDASRTSGRP